MNDFQPLRGQVFLAVGENGLRAFSRDAKTWTHLQTDRDGVLLQYACFFQGRCFAAGRFGGDLVAYHTSDAITWSSDKLKSKPYAERLELLFATDNEVCGIISTDGAPPQAIRTRDGKTWTARKDLLEDWRVMVHDAHLRRVARGNGRIVFTGDYGAKLSGKSLDDKFQAVPKASAKDTLIDIAFGNGVFVGSGLHALRMRSKDGLEWTDRTVGEEGEHINTIVFDGKQFVGIGQGATYTSPDGAAWKRTPNKNAPTVAAFGKGVYVGALWPGRVLRSTDGIDWVEVHKFPHNLLALTYGQIGPA